ncbi:MAG: BON domain-containing protein [Burkholderiales bacterium]|nr:BON domain-containing protein [Burkholderiales bacterium]
MRRAQISLLALAGAVAATLGLAACERAGDPASSPGSPSGAQRPERRSEAPMPSGPGMSGEQQGQAQPGAAAGGAAADAKIIADVKTALGRDPELSSQSIEVKAAEGKVSLTGSVSTAQASERATQVASTVVGVRAVENQLTVKGRG